MAAAIGVLASPIMLAPPADDRRPGACLAQDWKARLVDVPARRGVAVPVLRPCRMALGHHKTDGTCDEQMIVMVGKKLGQVRRPERNTVCLDSKFFSSYNNFECLIIN